MEQTKTNQFFTLMPLVVIAVLLIAAASFYGGMQYQKSHQSSTSASGSTSSPGGQFTGRGGFGTRANSNRVAGQVSAISSTSISVQDRRTGSTVTLAITGSTQITNNGQTATASDIQTGSTVFVTKDSSNPSNAASILVNPSFGGFGGSSSSPSSGSAPIQTN